MTYHNEFGYETVFGVKNCEVLENKPEYVDSNQFLRDIRPREADIGMFYITEETSVKTQTVPEFVRDRFSDVVTNKSREKLPEFKQVTHRIHFVPGAKPTTRTPYRMSKYEIDELKKQIEELLQHGFIHRSNSPYAAPVLFVKKKGKSLRLCVDYRLLNVNTIRNAFPIPVIEDLFMQIENAGHSSSISRELFYETVPKIQRDSLLANLKLLDPNFD